MSVLSQILSNPYLLPYEIGIVANLAVIVILGLRVKMSVTLIWFYAFLSTLIMLCVAQIGLSVAITQTPYDAFVTMRGVGLILLPSMMVFFTFSYLGMRRVLQSQWFHVVFPIPIGALIVLALHTQLVFDTRLGAAEWHRWGYHIAPGPLYGGVTFMLQVGFLLSLVLLFRAYRHAKGNVQRRRQLRLLFLAVLVPYAGEVIVQMFFGRYREVMPPPDSYLNIIMSLTIAYAIIRYGLFSVDSQIIGANVVNSMPGAVIALNDKNEIIFANPYATRFFGYEARALLGRSAGMLLPDQRAAAAFVKDVIKPLEDRGYREVLDRQIKTRSGQGVAVNVYASRLDDRSGRSIASVLVFSSIQEIKQSAEELRRTAQRIKEQNSVLEQQRQTVEGLLAESQRLQAELRAQNEHIEELVKQRTEQLQEAQAQLLSSINSLSQGFIMSGLHGQLLVNHAARQLFFPGMSLERELQPVDFQQKLGAAFDIQKAIDYCTTRMKAKNYPLVTYKNNFYHISAAPVVEAGKAIGCVLLVEDVTEEKVLQRSRDEFFSIASHELRTPLTAIRGNTSMVLQYYPEINGNNDLKEIIGDVYESSVRLIDIVNDFLETSRIEQGKMDFAIQDVALDKVVESVTYEMHSMVEHRKLYIKQDKTLGKLPLVRADPNRLKQVIYNVLGNAVKFTDKGGITISATVHAKKIDLHITDTGRGIPAENQKLLFHKFQQANASLYTRDTTRGTGLGLYISKLIMTHMKGAIALEKSTPGVGTTFVVTLPLAGR